MKEGQAPPSSYPRSRASTRHSARAASPRAISARQARAPSRATCDRMQPHPREGTMESYVLRGNLHTSSRPWHVTYLPNGVTTQPAVSPQHSRRGTHPGQHATAYPGKSRPNGALSVPPSTRPTPAHEAPPARQPSRGQGGNPASPTEAIQSHSRGCRPPAAPAHRQPAP